MRGAPRFARYLVVGATSTAVHYVTLIVLVRESTPVVGASAFGSAAGLLTHYALSSRWVFVRGDARPSCLSRFMVVSGLTLLLNAVLMACALALGFHYLLAQALSTAVVTLLNYALHANWTFMAGEVR